MANILVTAKSTDEELPERRHLFSVDSIDTAAACGGFEKAGTDSTRVFESK